MKKQISIIGLCCVLLAGCSKGRTLFIATPTPDDATNNTINFQTATPLATTPTEEMRSQMIIPDLTAIH